MGTATKKKKSGSSGNKLGSKIKSAAKSVLGGKSGSGKKRGKRSALWYEREVRRLRSKRKYDRERMRI